MAEMLDAMATKSFPVTRTNLVEDYDEDMEDTVSFVVDILDKDDNNMMVYRYVDGVEFGVVRRTQKVFIRLPHDTGRLVPFESGKWIVTLHFRRSRNPYFLPTAKRRRID